MQIRLASHLHRNRCGIYGFRFVISKLFHLYFLQKEYRFSLKTADKNKAKRLSCRYINLVKFSFERIIHSMNFNEASEHASQLLKSMNVVDFESIIDFVKALAETADDSNKKLASEIININKQVRELDEIRLKLEISVRFLLIVLGAVGFPALVKICSIVLFRKSGDLFIFGGNF